jgi:Putative adhesin
MTRPLPLTAGRWVTLAAGVPVALALIAFTALNVVAIAAVGTLSAGSADVSVGPGQPGRIRVRGTITYSLGRPHVSWQRGPSSLTLRPRCTFPVGECSAGLAVTVPAGGSSVISVGSGDLSARGLAGPVTLHSDSGNVTASGVSGRAAVSDNSGDIILTSVSGGRVVIRDSSGDISGTGLASPDVIISDQSGDISVSFSAVPDRVQVSDGSGNITLLLPPGSTSYQVSAITASGSTSIDVPRSAASPHVITVTDQSGDISISH